MKTTILIASLFLFFSPILQAAQNALVVTDQAPVFATPNDTAKQVATMKNGQKIRISSFPKNGWYKVLIPDGAADGTLKFGWIKQVNLALSTTDSNIKAADLEFKNHNEHPRRDLKENNFFIRVGGMYDVFFPSDITKSLGQSSATTVSGIGGFIEGSVRIDSNTKAALRIGNYSLSKTILYNSLNYDVNLTGTPVLLGLERLTYHSTSFDFSVALYAGMGFNNSAKITVATDAPNTFTMSGSFLATQINMVSRYWLSKNVALSGEFGLYYSRVPEKTVDTAFNGDAAFRNSDGNLKSLIINHLGPYLALGLEYGF